MANFRRHQQEVADHLSDPAVNRILAYVTPGGGKSLLPQIVAAKLIPRRVDKICWVVPRILLKNQAAGDFMKPWARGLVGHDMEIMEAHNEAHPSRGTSGYVVTYQSLEALNGSGKSNPHIHEFERHRYALILDESYHVPEGGKWHQAVAPLVTRAKFILFMTGCLERNDGKRLAYMPYRDAERETGAGHRRKGQEFDFDYFERTEHFPLVRCSLQKATDDRSIIHMDFRHGDGSVSYVDRDGEEVEVESLADSASDDGDALFSALSTGYAIAMLKSCAESWARHRRTNNRRAKLLVIAHSQRRAEAFYEYLSERCGISSVAIATSDHPAAQKRIKSFKKHDGFAVDVLVTVGMAYEGLDVPAITHVACLTHIRSVGWINQAFNRGSRFDEAAGPWARQRVEIWCPDDLAMKVIIDEIKEAQAPFVADRREGPVTELRGPNGDPNRVIPIESELTRTRMSSLLGEALTFEETERLQAAIDRAGVPLTPIQLHEVLKELRRESAPEIGNGHEHEAVDSGPTPGERINAKRNAIETYCREYDAKTESDFGTLNKRLFKVFEKSRKTMREDQLDRVLSHLQRNYSMPPSVSHAAR